MGTMASQITILTTVYPTVYSGTDQRNIKAPRHWPLWGGTGEFTTQKASNAENISIWWRHHAFFSAISVHTGYDFCRYTETALEYNLIVTGSV